MLCEHVHFIDYVDLPSTGHWLELHTVTQSTNVVDSTVRRSIDLDQVEKRSGIDSAGNFAIANRFSLVIESGVERFGEDACGRGLADASGASEEVSMRNTVRLHGAAQRGCDMFLSNHVRETDWPPLSIQDLSCCHKRDSCAFAKLVAGLGILLPERTGRSG